jgi:Ca2+-binding EF-hand superfamily protein
MKKARFAAMTALIVFTPGAYLFAEAPADEVASADAVASVEADNAKAQKSKAEKPKAPPLAQLLKSADANGDQKLDLAEIQGKAPKFPEKRFAALDKNHDGYLEASEMPKAPKADAEGAGAGKDKGRAEMREKLKAADTDGDGKLSQEEYAAAFPNAPAERFARLDRNSDGFVDRSDRESGEAAVVEKKKKGEAARKIGKVPADTATYITDLVAKHDADMDGKLTKAELEAAKPGFPEKTFAAIDYDKDGALSAADVTPSTN